MLARRAPETDSVLSIQDVTKRFGGLLAADGVSFEVASGEIVGLVGPNGSGKSTILNVITGGIAPDSGSVLMEGRSVVGLPIHKIAHLGLARTFQGIRIFRELTVFQNMALAAQGRSLSKWEGRAKDIIKRFKLQHLEDSPGGGLSIGQQRLLEIAMQLLGMPKILLFDEPLAGVHPSTRDIIKEILREQRDRGAAVLLIEHDMSFVMSCCDRIIALDQGAIIAEGPPDMIEKNELVVASLMGAKPAANPC